MACYFAFKNVCYVKYITLVMVTMIQMQCRCVTVAAIKCCENYDTFTSFQFLNIILHQK